MKVEVPVNMKFVEGAKSYGGQKAYSKQEAMEHFRKASAVATRPFIYLSAGVSNAEFNEALELAARVRCEIQWRVVRTSHMERRYSGLRQARRKSF